MKRTARIIIMMMVFFFTSMAGWAYAGDFVWEILIRGKAVQWVDWKNNPRFAIYDSGTPNDSSDDMVLDKETGLVWERSPSTSAFPWSDPTITTAAMHCNKLTLGNRKGWRFPTIQELATLVDPTQSNPALPAGYPFINVQSGVYWSATTNADDTSFAWYVGFFFGNVDNVINKSASDFVWCVRGGQGVDPQ